MANVSVYIPDDAKSKEVLKRVEMKRDLYKKQFGREISFSEMVMQGLALLVQVGKK